MTLGPSGLIVSPHGEPGQEIKKAAAELLQAFLNQFPRAHLAVKDGFVVSIANKNGPLIQIAGALDQGGPGAVHRNIIKPGGL
jgi:hypothetical protein